MKGSFTLRLVCCFTFLGSIFSIAAADAPLFPDKKLEAVVRQFVFEKRNNDEPLTESDVASLSTIKGNGAGIRDLTGLEKCKSLASLDLAHNELVDLSPLSDLPRLQYLDLANNRIEDIKPLGSVTALQYLELSHNRIENIRPLSSLTNLASLYVFHNEIRDAHPITTLPKLTSLYLGNNQIRDVEGFGNLKSLMTLSLSNNRIQDIAPLKGLNNLYYLFLENNEIRDLTSLVEMLQADFEGEKRFAPFINIFLTGNPFDSKARSQAERLKEFGAKVKL